MGGARPGRQGETGTNPGTGKPVAAAGGQLVQVAFKVRRIANMLDAGELLHLVRLQTLSVQRSASQSGGRM